MTPSQESVHGLVELTQVDNAFDESNKEDLKESNVLKSGLDKELEKKKKMKMMTERELCLDNIFLSGLVFSKEQSAK